MTNEFALSHDGSFTDFGWLTDLDAKALIFVTVALACYFFRRLKNLPTSWVWPITVIGILFYMVIGPDKPDVDPKVNLVWKFLYGLVPSIFGTVASWALHDKAFAALAAKWPIWGFLVSDEVKTNDPKPNP